MKSKQRNKCLKTNNRFKKLKLKQERKTPQNYKSPTQRSLIMPMKSTTATGRGWGFGGRKTRKKSKRIYRASQNIRIINVFLKSLCQNPFPHWESQSTSPPQDVLQHCADLWTCCGGSSDSNLVLLLCVLASNVHSYQNQRVFFCGSSQ